MSRSLFIVPIAVAILSGCASTPKMGNVIPAENDLYQVVSIGKSEDIALASALYSAETTCKQRRLRHIVLNHKTEYKGVIAEGANQTIDKALEIILRETGKEAPTLSGENDYRTTMQFRCE
ncbi:MAG: hypothetical protein ACXW11_07220 [Methylotenera sp.]